MNYRSLLFLILFFGISSCNNDEECADSILNITSFETEYGCVDTKYQMDIDDLSESYIIIRSQTEFDNQITGNCQPAIDFSIYDLVIGKKGLSNGNNSIDYELIKNCKTLNLILKVTFNQNETTEAPNLTYHALVSKLGDEQGLNTEIVIN